LRGRYTGHLTAVLPESMRLLMFKSDGSVLVHADAGGYKPLNRSGTEIADVSAGGLTRSGKSGLSPPGPLVRRTSES
jgi:RecB family endonuclease NucS